MRGRHALPRRPRLTKDMNHIDIPTTLRTLPLFSEVSDAEIAQIAAAAHEHVLAKGEMLFHQGDAPNGFYYLIRGQVKLAFTSRQGHEKIVEILGPNQSFGEAVLFMDCPYPVSAEALEDAQLLRIDRRVVFELIDQDPAFSRSLLAGMAIRLHGILRDVEDYSLHSGSQRLVSYLFSLREHTGVARDYERFTVELPSSKHVIASRLNLVPETFSRILRDLSTSGLITVNGRKVTLENPSRLNEFTQ